MSRMNH